MKDSKSLSDMKSRTAHKSSFYQYLTDISFTLLNLMIAAVMKCAVWYQWTSILMAQNVRTSHASLTFAISPLQSHLYSVGLSHTVENCMYSHGKWECTLFCYPAIRHANFAGFPSSIAPTPLFVASTEEIRNFMNPLARWFRGGRLNTEGLNLASLSVSDISSKS